MSCIANKHTCIQHVWQCSHCLSFCKAVVSCDACILCVTLHLDSGCVHAGQQMPAGGPQMGPEMMDQIQQRLSDPATADLISAFTQTMKPEDLAGMLKSGGMDVTPEQVRALCLPAEASDLSGF